VLHSVIVNSYPFLPRSWIGASWDTPFFSWSMAGYMVLNPIPGPYPGGI